jgi:hypothetical protein
MVFAYNNNQRESQLRKQKKIENNIFYILKILTTHILR